MPQRLTQFRFQYFLQMTFLLLSSYILLELPPLHAGHQQKPFTLTIESNSKDPRLCRVIVKAKQAQFWESLKEASDEQLQNVLSLKLQQPDQSLPAILGSYRIDENRLEFKPAFPLSHNSRYRAKFDPNPLELPTNVKVKSLSAIYNIPLPDAKLPRVLAVYPTNKRLPANHLKFYIQFSEPMQQGDIFQYLSLLNKTKNKQVPRPFRHTELWSRDGKQLTLWFHPGRQKVGVNLNVELGAILNQGDEYELQINPKWAALSGHALGKPFKKTFTAVAMDERQPKIENWKMTNPRKGTNTPLVCNLGESLDYALLNSQLKLVTAEGATVKGTVQLCKQESVWRFRPAAPWQAGRYRLVVGTVLEDLAGNSIARPFAIDLSKKTTSSQMGAFVSRNILIAE